RRHLPRGTIQHARAARAGVAWRRAARVAIRRAGGTGRDPGHVRGAGPAPLLHPPAAPAARALRAAALLHERSRRPRPRGAAERHCARHGGHRRPAVLSGEPGKPWAGRFTERTDPAAERFTASLAFDRRLALHDIAGSAAWASALCRAGLLTADEREAILKGLDTVRGEIESGTFPFRAELEDIHTNVERRLIELAGPAAAKLHTGRSRNDQIALDERLYLRDLIARVGEGLRRTQAALVARAAETLEAPMPGYTHLQ